MYAMCVPHGYTVVCAICMRWMHRVRIVGGYGCVVCVVCAVYMHCMPRMYVLYAPYVCPVCAVGVPCMHRVHVLYALMLIV